MPIHAANTSNTDCGCNENNNTGSSSLYIGSFPSLENLIAQQPNPEPGSWAHLTIAGAEDDTAIWDENDNTWYNVGQNNVPLLLYWFSYSLNAITVQDVVDRLNGALHGFTVLPTHTPVEILVYTMYSSPPVKYTFGFTGGKGKWGGGEGHTQITLGQVYFKSSSAPMAGEVPLDGTINLGVIEPGTFLAAANSVERDFSNPDLDYYFSYTIDGQLLFALFTGEPGIYGGESLYQFTNDDFDTTEIPDESPVIAPVGLVPVTENVNSGYRLSGENPDNHGDIGDGAVDETISNVPSSTIGATGTFSKSEGFNTTASGVASHAEGASTIAGGNYSHAEGYGSTASGSGAHSEGGANVASGTYSHAEGEKNFARARGEHAGGGFGTDYIPTGTEEDRLLNYGNGTDEANRSDALTLYRKGTLVLPSSSIAKIDSEGGKAVTTKEWVYRNLTAVPVEMFGAVGDGVADDWQAIQNALDSIYTHIVCNKNYRITRPIIAPDNKIFERNGIVKLADGFIANLTGDVAIGSNIVPVADADTYFSVGQQVCLSDDNRTLQGGATGQTRRTGASFFITAVDSTTVTLDNNVTYNFTTAANAKIGHCQSVLIIENVTSFKVTGIGKIDGNKANQYDVEPLMYNSTVEDTRFGCGITVQYAEHFHLDGIVQDCILHCINLHHVHDLSGDHITALRAHDKNILLWDVHDFNIGTIISKNPEYEDCLMLHSDVSRGTISNLVLEGGARLGLGISTNGADITVNNVVATNCSRAMSLVSAGRINVNNFQAKGGGQQPHSPFFNRPLIYVEGLKNSKLNVQVNGAEKAVAGIEIGGAAENITLECRIFDLIDSENSATGIKISSLGGLKPKNIFIKDSIVSRNDVGISIAAGCENIVVRDSFFSGNTTTLVNNAGREFKASGNIGITDTDLKVRDLYANSEDIALTGTTTETIIAVIPVLANEIDAGEIILKARLSRPAALGNVLLKAYHNTTQDLITGSPVQIASASYGTSTLYVPFERTYNLKSSNNLTGYNFASSSPFDTSALTVARSSTPFDKTIDNFIIFTAAISNSGDTLTKDSLSATWLKNT